MCNPVPPPLKRLLVIRTRVTDHGLLRLVQAPVSSNLFYGLAYTLRYLNAKRNFKVWDFVSFELLRGARRTSCLNTITVMLVIYEAVRLFLVVVISLILASGYTERGRCSSSHSRRCSTQD